MKRDSVRTKRNTQIYLYTNKKNNRHLFSLCVRDVINILEFLFCLDGQNNRHLHFWSFPWWNDCKKEKEPKKELEIHKTKRKKFKQQTHRRRVSNGRVSGYPNCAAKIKEKRNWKQRQFCPVWLRLISLFFSYLTNGKWQPKRFLKKKQKN